MSTALSNCILNKLSQANVVPTFIFSGFTRGLYEDVMNCTERGVSLSAVQLLQQRPLAGVPHVLAGGARQAGVRRLHQHHLAGHRFHLHLTPGGEVHGPVHPGGSGTSHSGTATSNTLQCRLHKMNNYILNKKIVSITFIFNL